MCIGKLLGGTLVEIPGKSLSEIPGRIVNFGINNSEGTQEELWKKSLDKFRKKKKSAEEFQKEHRSSRNSKISSGKKNPEEISRNIP